MRVRLEKDGAILLLNGQPIACGGEAAIYPVADHPDLLAKVYHAPTAEQADKLAAMIANPPADPTAKQGHTSIAWPTDRLFDADAAEGRCVGFVMPRVDRGKSLLEVYNPKARLQTWPLFHYGYLVRTARNLAIAVRALHARGYVLGDLNESNILVNGQTLVTVVDTDSFQVRTADRVFRCMVGKPEYIAPEIQNANFADVDRTLEHDHFALAVLIFQLLMQGTHPFAGRFTGEGEPEVLAKRIASGHWPYAKTRTGPFAPNPTAPPFVVLPPQVRELMRLCFEEGQERPAARPDAGRWQKALAEADEQLIDCLVNGQHKFHKSLDACPWCEMTARQGRDPFPAKDKPSARPEARVASVALAPIEVKPAEVVPVRTAPPRRPASSKPTARPAPSFWTTPWPWVIGGGGVAFLVIFTTAAALVGIALQPAPKPLVLGPTSYGSSFPRPQPIAVNPGPMGGPPGWGDAGPAPGVGMPGAGPGMPGAVPAGDVLPGGPPGPGGDFARPGIERPAAPRQTPELFGPDESRVATVRFAVPCYVFDKDFTSVLTLKNGGVGPAGLPPGGAPFPGPVGLNPGRAGVPAFPNNLKEMLHGSKRKGPVSAIDSGVIGGDFEMESVRLDDVAARAGVTLAEQPYPVRAAEIVAAFPYRRQVREFREKLGLADDDAVLQDRTGEARPGPASPAFRFRGVKVERRQVAATDKPMGPDEGWAPLPLEEDYRALLALNGGRTEEDDANLDSVLIPGLSMKKLATLGARRTPPVETFPALEKQLRNLVDSVNAPPRPGERVGRPESRGDPGDVFDFNPDAPGAGPAGLPGPMAPPRPGFDGPRGPMGPAGDDPRLAGGDVFLPEHCLIRFFDVTIEPGKTYEYRMKVRITNPNAGRRDRVPESPELEARDWYVVPQKARLAPDLLFYGVDQKELDANDPASLPSGARPVYAAVHSEETVVQVHRWVDALPMKGRGDLPIGDWAVAERIVVGRGEPLPRPRVELPYWRMAKAAFALATDPAKVGVQRTKVEMPLAPEGDEPILVDFTRGELTYLRTQPKTDVPATEAPRLVQDRALTEVLLCTADGRLLAHNAPVDAVDPERKARLKAVRDWIDQVKNTGVGRPLSPFAP